MLFCPGSQYSYNAPDLEDVKDSVRQGVNKVAGRMSTAASGLMAQLQVGFLLFYYFLSFLQSFMSP